jgi:hypothetical protein
VEVSAVVALVEEESAFFLAAVVNEVFSARYLATCDDSQ